MKRRPIVDLATHDSTYVTPPEIARFLPCDARTVVRMIEAGKIPGAYRAGRNWRIPTPVARRVFHMERTP